MGDLKRYALVLGNSDYQNLLGLNNSQNDCTSVGDKLKDSFGFQVTFAVNKSYVESNNLIDEFTDQANDNLSDIVFYYSGHGCSIEGRNYLIPIDGFLSSKPSSAKRIYIKLDDIIDSLVKFRHSDTVPIIVILDCCRYEYIDQSPKNHYSSHIKDEGRPANVFIMYAAGSNQTASDGEGNNSTFTECFLAHMDTNEDIVTIHKKILECLNGKEEQVPWISSSLLKTYNFRTASREHATPNPYSTSSQKKIFWLKYPENTKFVDRPEIFEKIDHIIKESKDSNPPKPIVLCGLGGTGKSQIALRFCYQNKDNYRYIFWMDADTETSLQNSFLDVANILNLEPDYTKAENVVPQIIIWLQSNDGWLLVFDNADDYSLGSSERRRLQSKYFPKSGKGVIIMTTRNNFGEQDGSTINFDDMRMDNNTALKLLLRKKFDSSNDYPSALEIVKQFGYLPLAIDLTGALMEEDNLTPSDFLKRYNEDPAGYLDLEDIQRRTGSAYGKTVLTVWKVSFDRIKTNNPLAASLLQSISFLYPDNIPFILFRHQCQAILKLDNIPSTRDLEAALHILQDFSFIRTIRKDCNENDPEKVTLTIHRLVQSVMRCEMKEHEQLQWLYRFISALNQEVPLEYNLNDKTSQKVMKVYMPQIRHVITSIKQYTNEYDNPKELISLLSPTIVYLIHQGLFDDIESLAELCVSISEKTNGQLHSAALTKLSYVYVSQSRFDLAEKCCVKSLWIRRKIFGPTHSDTISALHDLAYIYSNLGKEKHATQLYWEAAITDDQDAQSYLAVRYKQGIGASVNEVLSLYWKARSESRKRSHVNVGIRVDLTPLHHAVQQGDINRIRTRIEDYRLYATRRDRDGRQALHIAAEGGSIEILKLLVNDLRVDINSQDYYHGQTSLHLAAKKGDIEMVRSLITEFMADASITDINHKIAAQLAAEKGHLDIMKFIVLETAITDLDLKGNKIGDKGAGILAESLERNITLVNLSLEDNGISPDGVYALIYGLIPNININHITLTTLNLENNSIGSPGAYYLGDYLKHNTPLTNLNLHNNNITYEGAIGLADGLGENTTLTHLNLKNNRVGIVGTQYLAQNLMQNRTLIDLNLESNDISDEGARALADTLLSNTTLTNLNIKDNGICAGGANALVNSLYENTALNNLNFSKNSIGPEGARALAENLMVNNRLTDLNLSANRIGSDGARFLGKSLYENKTLTSLNLSDNDIGAEGISALAESLKQNTVLTNLDIKNNDIGIEGVRALAESLRQNSTITNLNFDKWEGSSENDRAITEADRAITEALKQNSIPTNINVEESMIDRNRSNNVSENSKEDPIVGLDFQSSIDVKIWNQEIKLEIRNNLRIPEAKILAGFLRQNITLTNLNLESSHIGAEGARALAESLEKNTALSDLNLKMNGIGPDGACALAKILYSNTALTNLNLSDNEIGAKGISALAESLKQNTVLTNLDIKRNSIGFGGARALAESLKQNTALTNIDLELNDIGPNGASDLAESLCQNTTLATLNLEYNSIGDEGVRDLAESLKQNSTLTDLDLLGNGISPDGAHALAESMMQNTSLTKLNLKNNNIGVEGACALANGLKQNTALTSLNLENNGVGSDGTNALAESLKQNTTLTNLNLKWNNVGTDGARALAESLKQNTTLIDLNLENNGINRALTEGLYRNTTLINLSISGNDTGAEV